MSAKRAIQILLPSIPDEAFVNDIHLREEGSGFVIDRWSRPEQQPTQAELDAVTAQADQMEADATSRATNREAMRAQWDALPAWLRGPYRPLFDAANKLLDEGDDEAAAEMINAAEPNALIAEDETVYPELGGATKAQYFAAVKAQFLTAIQALPS